MKITNLVMWAQDNTVSVKFYKKLGFEITQSDERNSTVRLADFELMLVSMRDEDEFNRDSLAHDKGRGIYIYVQTDDVDRTYDDIKKHGIVPYSEPRDWDWGNREFIVKDPDGYKLCFYQKLA